MAKRPVEKYGFKPFGAAIKAARTERRESRQKTCDEMYISPRYLANIENKGQHPSLQIFLELMLRYNISVDQLLFDVSPAQGKSTQRRQLDALLDNVSFHWRTLEKQSFHFCNQPKPASLVCAAFSSRNSIVFAFLGRSIGDSVASTRIISYTISLFSYFIFMPLFSQEVY